MLTDKRRKLKGNSRTSENEAIKYQQLDKAIQKQA